MNPYQSPRGPVITRDEIIRLMPGRMAYGAGFWRGFYVGFITACLFVASGIAFGYLLMWLAE